jgi:argininosuccinate synthase
MGKKIGVVAFSGGLDTSFLVPFSREQYMLDTVITCTVNTGGFGEAELSSIAQRSKEVGADKHISVDGQQEFYDSVLKYLVFGNVTRDGYPLSVGSERVVQARKVLDVCKSEGASVFLHGSTGAGNDQYRFDGALHVLGRNMIEVKAPVREFGFSREYTTKFLTERGVSIPQRNSSYSYNVGLWGVSIGGKETHTSTGLIPDEAWYSKPNKELERESAEIHFSNGEPVKVKSTFGDAVGPVDCIKKLTELGNAFAIGRKYHVGTSIPGKKGRLAYEAPAAEIIYEAHRTLEKLVLSQAQITHKQGVANEVGKMVHEARSFDPLLEDCFAYLRSSQRQVHGVCTVNLRQGYIESITADSPYNLLAAKGAVYGEVSNLYSPQQAEGATRLHAIEQMICSQTAENAGQ